MADPIEKIVGDLLVTSGVQTIETTVSPEDFHGDGAGSTTAKLSTNIADLINFGGYLDDANETLSIFGVETELDEIVSVERVENYSGHVYNLQTSSGTYIAEGVVAHNCRCALASVVEE